LQISPDGKYLVDTFSQPDVAPETVLRDGATGALIMPLEKADISKLLATGWKPPMQIKMTAADGKTSIYGMLFRPTNFDPSKKYPIINNAYPGPQSGSVGSRAFTVARGDKQALAELGFVVVSIDGTGTAEPIRRPIPTPTTARWAAIIRSRTKSRDEGAGGQVSVDRHRQGRDVGPFGRRLHHR